MAQLKHELKIRQVILPRDKKKDSLRKQLRDALAMKKLVMPVTAPEVEAEDDMADFALGAKWTPLTADADVDEVVNVDFPNARAPTVPAEEAAKVQPLPKQEFSRIFDRPPCVDGPTTRQQKESFLERHNLTKDSSAVEFAEAFFPMCENPFLDSNGDHMLSMQHLARNTNARAAQAFAGEATYDEWAGDFSIKEMRQFLGLYVLHGLSPSPGLERKFDKEDVANYNAFATTNLGSNPSRRLRQFKAFFGCQDPMKVAPDRRTSPLFKVLSIVKWVRRIGPLSWECGIDLGLDEQTLGFQGRHADKMRITHKAEGDGFQCDALCDGGFTYSVFFRNEPPPREHTQQGHAALHSRSLWLFDQLERKHHRVWVDNYYMSAKFAKAAFKGPNKVLLTGVTRSGRGAPQMVTQKEVKPADAPTTRGTVKAAVLEGDPDCPELIALSITTISQSTSCPLPVTPLNGDRRPGRCGIRHEEQW